MTPTFKAARHIVSFQSPCGEVVMKEATELNGKLGYDLQFQSPCGEVVMKDDFGGCACAI